MPNRSSTFVVEGRWNVEALIQSEFEIESIFVADGQHEDLVAPLPITCMNKAELAEKAGFQFHRGILAHAKRPTPNHIPAETLGCLVVCHELADESNLGAIVRNAAALGAGAIAVQANHGADLFSRKSIRASSGAVFRLPVFESPDLFADLLAVRKNGVQIVASSLGPASIPLHEAPKAANFALLLGSERSGLPQSYLEICDTIVKIPMQNEMESLNVASSSAILLHELLK